MSDNGLRSSQTKTTMTALFRVVTDKTSDLYVTLTFTMKSREESGSFCDTVLYKYPCCCAPRAQGGTWEGGSFVSDVRGSVWHTLIFSLIVCRVTGNCMQLTLLYTCCSDFKMVLTICSALAAVTWCKMFSHVLLLGLKHEEGEDRITKIFVIQLLGHIVEKGTHYCSENERNIFSPSFSYTHSAVYTTWALAAGAESHPWVCRWVTMEEGQQWPLQINNWSIPFPAFPASSSFNTTACLAV